MARHRRRVMITARVIPTTYMRPYTWMNSGPRWNPLTDGLGMKLSGKPWEWIGMNREYA